MNEHVLRRYTFKLYPSTAQVMQIETQARMLAALWNALLQRNEDTHRCAEQRQSWIDANGKKRKGISRHASDGAKTRLSYHDMCREITALRAECPEWAALSTSAARGVAQRLDQAFQAFFRRVKSGAGAQSGYPRYKRVRDGMSICFTEKSGVGWRIRRSKDYVATDKSSGGWFVYVKGVPGEVKARGRLPREATDWRTGEIIHRDGHWWLSVVVQMKRNRPHGSERVIVRFDLIDEFARVERADGGAPAASKEGMTLHSQQHGLAPGAVSLQTEGNEPLKKNVALLLIGAVSLQTEGNEPQTEAEALCRRADRIKSERDRRFPRKPFTRPSRRWRRETSRAARLTAKAARIRRHALHRWSYEIVTVASDLTVIAPKVKENIASPRGTKREWGAEVATVSELNRNTLNQAPAMAMQMLAYKAAEAGIRCDVVTDEAPKIAIGAAMVSARRTTRRIARQIRKETCT